MSARPRLEMPAEAVEAGITPDQWRVLVDAVWPSARTASAVMLAVAYCRARGLDPIRRPVHIVPVWDRRLGREVETVWPGLHTLLADAHRTGECAGVDEPVFGPAAELTWTDQDGSVRRITYPEWCAVTVHRLVRGHRVPFSARVHWRETYARVNARTEAPNEMWRRRPYDQLAKCALAAALRTAFPEASSVSAEEMEGQIIDTAPPPVEGRRAAMIEAARAITMPAASAEPAEPVAAAAPAAPAEPAELVPDRAQADTTAAAAATAPAPDDPSARAARRGSGLQLVRSDGTVDVARSVREWLAAVREELETARQVDDRLAAHVAAANAATLEKIERKYPDEARDLRAMFSAVLGEDGDTEGEEGGE